MSVGLHPVGLLPVATLPSAPAGGGSNQTASPSANGLTITGGVPTVARTENLVAAPTGGNLTVSGGTPVVSRTDHQYAQPGASALTIVGGVPAVTQTSGATALPGSGSIAITGGAPTVSQTANQLAEPAAGALSITGNVPTVSQTTTPVDPRYARPHSTVSAGTWLPSTGSSLAAMIDEASADSADYIYTTSASTCEIGLGAVEDPGTSSGQVVRYQVWSPSESALTVSLKQGAATIASWLHVSLPTTPTVYERALSSAECDSITNYSDLRFEFTAA